MKTARFQSVIDAAGTPEQHELVTAETQRVCREAYAAYRRMLEAGIAREVARVVLPLTIYSSMYVTVNARSLMNFLSLRTKREELPTRKHGTMPL